MNAIDIVVNLFTEQEVRLGQTGLDETFKAQIRMPEEMRGGVSIENYLTRMDRASIQRSLLIAVRAGDMMIKGSIKLSNWAAMTMYTNSRARIRPQRSSRNASCCSR